MTLEFTHPAAEPLGSHQWVKPLLKSEGASAQHAAPRASAAIVCDANRWKNPSGCHRADHTMAGDDDGDWIAAVGPAHRPCGVWADNRPRLLAIALVCQTECEEIPSPSFKVTPGGKHRHGEFGSSSREILRQLRRELCKLPLGMNSLVAASAGEMLGLAIRIELEGAECLSRSLRPASPQGASR